MNGLGAHDYLGAHNYLGAQQLGLWWWWVSPSPGESNAFSGFPIQGASRVVFFQPRAPEGRCFFNPGCQKGGCLKLRVDVSNPGWLFSNQGWLFSNPYLFSNPSLGPININVVDHLTKKVMLDLRLGAGLQWLAMASPSPCVGIQPALFRKQPPWVGEQPSWVLNNHPLAPQVGKNTLLDLRWEAGRQWLAMVSPSPWTRSTRLSSMRSFSNTGLIMMTTKTDVKSSCLWTLDKLQFDTNSVKIWF